MQSSPKTPNHRARDAAQGPGFPAQSSLVVGGANAARAVQAPRSLQRQSLQAAGQLIGDDSRAVRRAVRQEFERGGKLGLGVLRRAAQSPLPRVRSHARSLLEGARRAEVIRRLLRFSAAEQIDLERAFFLLANLERPSFDSRPFRRALDAMAAEVDKRTRHLKDDLQRCQVLVHYLGSELDFCGDFERYTHPDNIYFHRVIERKQGLPLSLCALYSFVARRVGLQTGIIPLPGHVMLRLYGACQNLIVDPFHGGEARTQDDLVKYLRQHGLRFNPVWMHDASPKLLFARQVANLGNSLCSLGLNARVRELDPLLTLLGH